jgi:hypothetical protein
MTEIDGKITHVSDTALMVAACRAHQSGLEDAFVRDPFAARLAGERGVAILCAMPHANVLRIGLAIRTRFVDELLMDALATYPIATVLSVGCGLDTRPWRLDLPPDLRWVEVDFADVLDYKGGSWQNMGEAGVRSSAKWNCDNVAQGTARDLLPDILPMTHHAMFEKSEKKTVNGVQCREWKFDIRSAVTSQKGSVCIGVDDHLPYEMTAENGARYSYSDYNRPIQIEVPKTELQPVSSTDGSN